MKVEELLPPGRDGVRQFLDWQSEALHSPAKYLALVGGVGSGKNIIGSVLGVALSLQIPGNRGIVLRRTYIKLHDSTETTFLEVLERANIAGVRYLETHNHYPHRIVLPNDSEIVFRESKDAGRYLGPEYGWFLLDEAAEEPEETFKGLMTRLRLQRADRYLKGILLTNPPHKKHWIAKYFGIRPGMRESVDSYTGATSKYHLIQSSTRQNIHLPPGYLGDLLINNPDAEIARIIDGHFGFTQDGAPVYPQFAIRVHVRDDGFKTGMPIIRGYDFGFHHPAVTWHQLWRCSKRHLHWSVLHEMDGSEIESADLLDRVMVETAVCFPDTSRFMFLDAGDRAGAQSSDKGPGPIVRAAGPPWFVRIRYRACPIEPGLELIRKYLSFRCPCGLPGMIIDSSCVSVIEGMQGGYHYPKNYRGRKEEVPFKDHFFDDFMDSVRYVGENFVRLEEKGAGFIQQLMAEDLGAPVAGAGAPSPNEWMGIEQWLNQAS